MHRPIDVAFMFLKAEVELKEYDDTPLPSQTPQPPMFTPPPLPNFQPGQTYLSNFPSQNEDYSKVLGGIRVIPSRYFSNVTTEGMKPLRQTNHNVNFELNTDVAESKRRSKLEDKYGVGRSKKIMGGKDTGDEYYGEYRPFKRFHIGRPTYHYVDEDEDRVHGTWWTRPGVRNAGRAYTDVPYKKRGRGYEETSLIGYRGDMESLEGQFRDAVESQEGFPEALISEHIDPRDLVYFQATEEDRAKARERTSNDLMFNRTLMEIIAEKYGLPTQALDSTSRGNAGRLDFKDPASNWGQA